MFHSIFNFNILYKLYLSLCLINCELNSGSDCLKFLCKFFCVQFFSYGETCFIKLMSFDYLTLD